MVFTPGDFYFINEKTLVFKKIDIYVCIYVCSEAFRNNLIKPKLKSTPGGRSPGVACSQAISLLQVLFLHVWAVMQTEDNWNSFCTGEDN